MSRLSDKIDKAREEISDAQDRLQELEDRQRRYNRKRNKKDHRRKYMTDPSYRLMCRMERHAYNEIALPAPFLGIDAQIRGTK